MRWWWNLTIVGKLLFAAFLIGLSGLGWAMYREAQGPEPPRGPDIASQPAAPPSSPTHPTPTPPLSPTPPVTPTPPRPVPSPTPTPTPTPTPAGAATPGPTGTPGRVIDAVRILYTTCEGDGACGAMASGRLVHPGAAACNPSLAPFGTRLRIRGWDQEVVCEDIHPTMQGWYVIVWFATEAEGQAFRQRVGPTASVEVLYTPAR